MSAKCNLVLRCTSYGDSGGVTFFSSRTPLEQLGIDEHKRTVEIALVNNHQSGTHLVCSQYKFYLLSFPGVSLLLEGLRQEN